MSLLFASASCSCAGEAAPQGAASDTPKPTAPETPNADLEIVTDGARLELSVGQSRELRLPTFPAQPYAWHVSGVDPAGVIELGELRHEPVSGPCSACGDADATFVAPVRAVGPGEVTVTLVERHVGTLEPEPGLVKVTIVVR